MNRLIKNQYGIAHPALILIITAVVAAGGLAYWRVSNANEVQNRSSEVVETEKLEALPENLDNIKTLEEIEQIAGVGSGTNIIKFVLETKDGKYIYKVTLSDGRKLVIDASNGQIISEEKTDISDDDMIPAGLEITVSPAQAYKLAAAKSSSPIKQIEMEVEDKKVVYKIEFKDGSKIEIDATNGAILKSKVKGSEAKDEDDSNDDSNEDRDEDDKDEPEDESEDDDDKDEPEDESEDDDDKEDEDDEDDDR